jgi:Porin PorA
MRRWVGLTLAGLGAFLLVGAALLRFYIPDQVIRYPLNEYIVSTLEGTGMSYFSPSTGQPVTGATIRVTDTMKGDAAAGTSTTAVWNEFTYVYDTSRHVAVQYQNRRFAFDRRTGTLVNCCGANMNGNPEVRQYGQVLFPFGTGQGTYQMYDPVLEKTQPARYAGTATVAGISVYRYVERVPDTAVGSLLTVPASVLGMPGSADVTLTEHYAATNTFWVDPATGQELKVAQDQKISYVDSSGVQRMLAMSGTLTMTPRSVQHLVNLDSTLRTTVTMLTTVGPLVAGLAGLAALVAGVMLAWPRRGDQPGVAGTAATKPALDPAL